MLVAETIETAMFRRGDRANTLPLGLPITFASLDKNESKGYLLSNAPPIPLQRHHTYRAQCPNARFKESHTLHDIDALHPTDVASPLVLVVPGVVLQVVLAVQPLILLRDAAEPDVVGGGIGGLLGGG